LGDARRWSAHHIDFPDYTDSELLRIAEIMLAEQNCRLSAAGREAMTAYIAARNTQSLFANARSIRNALDRARLRQANRVFAGNVAVAVEALSIIAAPTFWRAEC
jgi:hypothetical protein